MDQLTNGNNWGPLIPGGRATERPPLSAVNASGDRGFGLGFGVRLQDGLGVAPGSTGDAMWAGAWGTSFTIDRAEGLVAIFMAQGPSRRGHTRMLFKNLVYGAMVESRR